MRRCSRARSFSSSRRRCRPSTSTPLLDGVTHVFHLAAQAGVRRSWGADFRIYTSHNIDATQRLLEAVKERPLTRLRLCVELVGLRRRASTIPMREDSVLQPVSPYGVTKLAAEHLCHLYSVNYGVPTVSLRYFTVYGPRQRPDMGFHRFIRAALEGQPIHLYGDGDQTRDFTYVADIVAATMAAGDRGQPGAVYNIGGGSRVSISDVLDLIERLTGRALDIRREAAQKGDMRDTFADTTRARADLGFAPALHARSRSRRRDRVARQRLHVDAGTLTMRDRLRRCVRVARCARRSSSWRRRRRAAAAARCRRTGSVDADKFLFDRGMGLLKDKKWLTSREYFRRLIDTYPTSAYRYDAKLGIGDSYLGEGRVDSLILAANEFREFLTFFPVAERVRLRAVQAGDGAVEADALAAARPDRDARGAQGNRHVPADLQGLALRPEVEKLHRQTRDRLSESEFAPGLLYYRIKWYPGAIDRFTALLTRRPGLHEQRQGLLLPGRVAARSSTPLPAGADLLREAARREAAEQARQGRRSSGSPRSSADAVAAGGLRLRAPVGAAWRSGPRGGALWPPCTFIV